MIPTSTLLVWLDTVDREYWLRHCEGFQVEAGGRPVGVVEHVHHGPGFDDPDSLWVRGGVLGNRRALVPIRDVAALDPRAEIVSLIDGATPRRRGGHIGRPGSTP
jgi:hypothetical protein